MIKVNVEINNRSWRKEIKNSKKYFNEKLKKINLQVSKLVKQQRWYLFKTKRRTKNKITFNILLTDSQNMKRLNKQFRRKCKSTDVLSFPNYYTGKLNIWSRKFSLENLYERIDLMTGKSEGFFISLLQDRLLISTLTFIIFVLLIGFYNFCYQWMSHYILMVKIYNRYFFNTF